MLVFYFLVEIRQGFPIKIYLSSGTTNGGQIVTLDGSGFLEGHTKVTICNERCVEKKVTASKYTCVTSAHSGKSSCLPFQ